VPRHALLSVVLAALVLAGCAGTRYHGDTATREAVIETALGQVGRPYRYGGASPDGFDCSGLVQYSYAQAGVRLPHNTSQLLDLGSRIDLDEARPGDLVFYRFADPKNSLHVAIYLGDGRLVHAPASGGEVSVIRADARPWPQRYLGALRLLP
jgi:cell wall-associated NlpC family hydrolase